jgi:CRP-like cAMP-binding protein
MFEQFELYIRAHGEFTAADLALMRSLCTMKKLRRRQLLLREGEICQYKIFVCKGLLKTYRLKDDGTEYIMRFSPEHSWTTDPESLEHGIPSHLQIEALENSEVILWTKDQLARLLEAIPAFQAFTNKLISSSLSDTRDRLYKTLSYTSEEKYQDFIASFPDVFQRVPLHMVASYLGVSRETLSRIRQAQVHQPKEG